MILTDFQILENPSSRHSAEKYLGKLTHNLEMSSCLECLNKSKFISDFPNKKIQIIAAHGLRLDLKLTSG